MDYWLLPKAVLKIDLQVTVFAFGLGNFSFFFNKIIHPA
tara:strand:+ start:418 stop:534 length:117 start_codon:yes stop_codon:yes gene_type:complete